MTLSRTGKTIAGAIIGLTIVIIGTALVVGAATVIDHLTK